jgi:hypothetical protein
MSDSQFANVYQSMPNAALVVDCEPQVPDESQSRTNDNLPPLDVPGEKTNTTPESKPTEIGNLTPLFEHAKTAADELGHPYHLSRKEWDQSSPPFASQVVVAECGTWKRFIDNAGIDAESREEEKRTDRIAELLDECFDRLVSEECISEEERNSIEDQVWFCLTGVR